MQMSVISIHLLILLYRLNFDVHFERIRNLHQVVGLRLVREVHIHPLVAFLLLPPPVIVQVVNFVIQVVILL